MSDSEKELERIHNAHKACLQALLDHYPTAVKSGKLREWANCLHALADLAKCDDNLEAAFRDAPTHLTNNTGGRDG